MLRTILLMWRLRLAYFFGADPATAGAALSAMAAAEPVAIAILAKAPVAGFAKTRLIPALGAEPGRTIAGAR